MKIDFAYNWYRNEIVFDSELGADDYIEIGGVRIPNVNKPGLVRFVNEQAGFDGHDVELQLTARPTDWWRIVLNVGYRQIFDNSTGLLSRFDPIWSLAAGTDLSNPCWSASLRLFFSDAYFTRSGSPDGMIDPDLIMEVPAALLLNARVAYILSEKPFELSVGLEGFNLLGNRHREHAGVPVPGRPDYGGESFGRRVVLFLSGRL